MKKYSLKTKVFGFIKNWFYLIYFIIQLPFTICGCDVLVTLFLKDRPSRISRLLGMIGYYIGAMLIILTPWWKAENFENIIDHIYNKSKAKDEKTINIVTDDEEE